MTVPQARYAKTGSGLSIAYQKWGSGPPCLIVPALISNIEIVWEHELYRRVLERMGKFMTCVMFDKRGIGLSDRFDGVPTLEERIEDMTCVMEAAGWQQAHLLGNSEGGLMALLFAANHPERVLSLAMYGPAVPHKYRPLVQARFEEGDAPIPTNKQISERFLKVADTWGEDATFLVDYEMPSQNGNEGVTRWMARLCRMSCSPRDFRRQFDSLLKLDAGDAPERIRARTLVRSAKGDKVLPAAGGRVLASVIPGAIYQDISGEDHFYWFMPVWRSTLDHYIEFATGQPVPYTVVRKFAIILCTDIVNSTKQAAAAGDTGWRETMEGHDRLTRELVSRHGGQVMGSTGDGLQAIFDVPSQAVPCGAEMLKALADIGVTIRAGVHAGEIGIADGVINGIAVNLATRVSQKAADGEFWASSTVRDMMLGGSTPFADRGQHELKGFDEPWRLYGVGRR